MSIRTYVVALVAAAAVAVGCQSRGSLPVSPSVSDGGTTTNSANAPLQLTAVSDHGKTVILSDGCDPETFNDPINGVGPGTCGRAGGVRFANFLEELSLHHSVGAWHMAPREATLRVGEMLSAFNNGGEVHTFTEVDEFGGGLNTVLNGLMGLTTVAPECAQSQMLHPGQSSSEVEDEEGVEHYQCCIHPWMRADVRIIEK